MTDHEIAKYLDSKQYGTIHDDERGRDALHSMATTLDYLALRNPGAPHVSVLSKRLGRVVYDGRGRTRSLKEMEMTVMELDHDGYPETAREFADVLKQMRALERR